MARTTVSAYTAGMRGRNRESIRGQKSAAHKESGSSERREEKAPSDWAARFSSLTSSHAARTHSTCVCVCGSRSLHIHVRINGSNLMRTDVFLHVTRWRDFMNRLVAAHEALKAPPPQTPTDIYAACCWHEVILWDPQWSRQKLGLQWLHL